MPGDLGCVVALGQLQGQKARLRQPLANTHAPWLGLSGSFTLAIMLTLLVFVGEGVCDAFDPRRSAALTALPG
ncbi:MAG: hypothetical protein OXH15_13180 [Gammaproteobacteria bacterium]|nr:hypothetical protein [Gammaproteobacteria bacterium]